MCTDSGIRQYDLKNIFMQNCKELFIGPFSWLLLHLQRTGKIGVKTRL